MLHYDFETFEHLQQAQEMVAKFAHWFQIDHAVRWGIFEKETQELIGSCCLDTFHKATGPATLVTTFAQIIGGKGSLPKSRPGSLILVLKTALSDR